MSGHFNRDSEVASDNLDHSRQLCHGRPAPPPTSGRSCGGKARIGPPRNCRSRRRRVTRKRWNPCRADVVVLPHETTRRSATDRRSRAWMLTARIRTSHPEAGLPIVCMRTLSVPDGGHDGHAGLAQAGFTERFQRRTADREEWRTDSAKRRADCLRRRSLTPCRRTPKFPHP